MWEDHWVGTGFNWVLSRPASWSHALSEVVVVVIVVIVAIIVKVV